MMDKPKHYAQFEAPDLAPVIAVEHTPTGWRGLTEDGEILNVNAHVNGAPVAIPDSISIARGGEVIGYRKVPAEAKDGVIDAYTHHLNASTMLLRANQTMPALEEINIALAYAPTALARYNRALILLALGYWPQGFDEFAYCEQNSPLFMRPQYRAAIDARLEPWCGQDIAGKTLLLIHDHGFGDSIMCLRYVPILQAMGADVVLMVPPELQRLAAQLAPVTDTLVVADYVCSLLLLMQVRQEAPERIDSAPYLKVDPTLVDQWKNHQHTIDRAEGYVHRGKRIGIAWSIGKVSDGDYPRACPRGLFEQHLGDEGHLISVQQNNEVPFDDFADCAALMSLMDEIVTVDTAAAHLAGAIGHPNVTLLLSHWASWRWRVPLYQNVRICQQDSAGDWDSAFAKRHLGHCELTPERLQP